MLFCEGKFLFLKEKVSFVEGKHAVFISKMLFLTGKCSFSQMNAFLRKITFS